MLYLCSGGVVLKLPEDVILSEARKVLKWTMQT